MSYAIINEWIDEKWSSGNRNAIAVRILDAEEKLQEYVRLVDFQKRQIEHLQQVVGQMAGAGDGKYEV